MNANSLKLIAGPLLSMVEGMVPKEAANNKEALFVQELVNTFMPATNDEMLLKVKQIVTDMAVVAVNRDPDAFRERLIELDSELKAFLRKG